MYKDKEKAKARFRVYYWKHPFRRMAKAIRKKDKLSSVTEEQLKDLFETQKGICPLTGLKLELDDCSPDHVIPRSLGGASHIGNIRIVHKWANNARGICDDASFVAMCKAVASFHA